MPTEAATTEDVPAPLRALGLRPPELAYFVLVLQCAERRAVCLRNFVLSLPALLGVGWLVDTPDDAPSGASLQGIADQVTPLVSIAFPAILLLCLALYGLLGSQIRRMVDDAPLRGEARQLLRETVSAMGRHVWARLFQRLRGRWR